MTDVSHDAFFDDYQFTLVPGLRILGLDPYKPPKRKLFIADIIQSNRSKVSSGFFNEKLINIRIDISRASRNLLQGSIDTLMSNIQGVEKSLIVPQNFAFRRYTATYEDIVITNDGGSYIEATLVFRCSDRFGYDTAKTLLLNNTTITNNFRIITLTTNIDGSARYQAPVITITVNSVTNGGTPTITVGNANNGQVLTVSRTWAAGDLLIIDAANRTVQVNGIDVAYTGALPTWLKGGAVLSYSDGLTARNLTLKVDYFRRWL